MTRGIWLAALGLLGASGCRTPAAPAGGQASPSSSAAVARAPLSAVPFPASPERFGSSSSGAKNERERALFAFLEGGQAARVEVVATEPGQELDRSLRQSLLGHVVESAPILRGDAQVGPASVTGGEISNLHRVVAGMRAGFRNCYQRALSDAPDYAGQLAVRLSVDAEGAVTAAKVTSSKRNAAVFTCVEARAAAAQFAPPSDRKPATVTFSVTLSKP